jgi:hypothetical protein
MADDTSTPAPSSTPPASAPPSAAADLFADRPAPISLAGFVNPDAGNYRDQSGNLRYHRTAEQLAQDRKEHIESFDRYARRAAFAFAKGDTSEPPERYSAEARAAHIQKFDDEAKATDRKCPIVSRFVRRAPGPGNDKGNKKHCGNVKSALGYFNESAYVGRSVNIPFAVSVTASTKYGCPGSCPVPVPTVGLGPPAVSVKAHASNLKKVILISRQNSASHNGKPEAKAVTPL